MTSSRSTDSGKAAEIPLSRLVLYAVRYYLGDRRVLWALAAAALVGGLALNWSWLVAAGVAPILLAALPCVAMCALGLCANKMAGRTDTDASHSPLVRKAAESDGDAVAPAARVGSAVGMPMACCAESHESAAPAAAANAPQSKPPEERRNPDA
jgi:hypothetical protein